MSRLACADRDTNQVARVAAAQQGLGFASVRAAWRDDARGLLGVLSAISLLLFATAAARADTIEAIGAQSCGGSAKSYTVEFLAPETAVLLGDAKVIDAAGRMSRAIPSLSLDGRACSNGECDFRARKGQTYILSATRAPNSIGKLCISVVRP